MKGSRRRIARAREALQPLHQSVPVQRLAINRSNSAYTYPTLRDLTLKSNCIDRFTTLSRLALYLGILEVLPEVCNTIHNSRILHRPAQRLWIVQVTEDNVDNCSMPLPNSQT
jgi:hypothetical protein